MKPADAAHIADRIRESWPQSKITHEAWVTALTPDAAGHDPCHDVDRMNLAVTRLTRKQPSAERPWPPSIADVLGEYNGLAGSPAPTPAHLTPRDAPGLANPVAPADTLDRFKLDPDFCATGISRAQQLKEQMIAQAAAAPRPGRRKPYTGTTAPTHAPDSPGITNQPTAGTAA